MKKAPTGSEEDFIRIIGPLPATGKQANMRTMRRLAFIAIMLVPLRALPAGALDAPLPPASASIPLQADGPPVHLSALGLLAPGSPQFILGEPLKGGAFLAGTGALGVGAYFVLRSIFYADSFTPGAFYPAESDALIMLNAAGLAWLTGGALSTLDAYWTLQAKQSPTAATPSPLPSVRLAPTPAPMPSPVLPSAPAWTPTPSPTAIPTPRPTPTLSPAPRVTASPSVAPKPQSTPDPEAAVYRAYDLAAKGQYLAAVTEVQDIRDPDWLPKANALLAEWASKAVDQGLTIARGRMAEGDMAAAKLILDRVASLPRTAAQTRALNTLRQGLR